MSAAGDMGPPHGLDRALGDLSPRSHPRRGRASPRNSVQARQDAYGLNYELDAIRSRIERALSPLDDATAAVQVAEWRICD